MLCAEQRISKQTLQCIRKILHNTHTWQGLMRLASAFGGRRGFAICSPSGLLLFPENKKM